MIQKNFKIKWFLIASFALVLLLMIGLGTASLFYTQRLADQTIDFFETPHNIQINVAEVRRDMSEIGSTLKSAVISRTPEGLRKAEQEIDVLLQDMTARIGEVQQQFRGDKKLLDNADVIVAEWLGLGEEINQLLAGGQYDQAVRVFEGSYTPVEEELGQAVQKISDYAAQDSVNYYQSAQRSKTISVYVIVGTVVFTIILAFVICSSVVTSIAIPLKEINRAAQEIAKGNLNHEIKFTGKNEFGQLADSMRRTTATLSDYVGNIDMVLERMSKNDLTVSVDLDYVGDFAPIKKSMERIIEAMNSTMLQISECSEQVAGGAEQVSGSSQILSQGASEQASSLEELSASIAEITAQVGQNSEYTDETNELVMRVGSELERGNQQMQQMLGAISEINDASDQIAKIIKTIEDIAFQTNILALNAAVEAARAGAAGKGFAVVADEVRNLAGKSAEAAKSTTALIQNSIRAVQNGTDIADGTAAALSTVVQGAEKIATMVAKIASATEGQAMSLVQINQAVTQISGVVQTNSATAEESAAASQEMSGQSQVLKGLVRQFKIKKNGYLPASEPQPVYEPAAFYRTPGGSKY